ncbi:hypothetical protein G7062_04860 [Erysipelothrix sp. HDW6C]|uniref:hypothetical protein n=1 Tax=Erysipelothrix sp. HDW6C TaxID=2714930 RepID=UPI00140C4969|nr:hypothetical protein [Erysipelothrix sp. HDW6C]QIK69668.1 hypothetical protein G7062_04860 [Erysipelothrix sp. HDW6C]
MISTLKFIAIGVSLLIVLALPIVSYMKFRKDKSMFKAVLFGLLVYFAMNILYGVMQSTIANPQTMENPIMVGATYGIFMSVGFVLAALAVLSFVIKRNEVSYKFPAMMALGFMLLFFVSSISALMNQFMFGFAINSGSTASAVNPSATPEQVQAFIDSLVNAPLIFFINSALTRVFEYAVYMMSFILVFRGIKENSFVKTILPAVLAIFLLYAIPGLLNSLPFGIYLAMIAQGLIAGASGYFVYNYLKGEKA